MKKRLFCLGLLLVMVFSFAACGGEDTAKKPTVKQPIVPEEEITEFIETFDRHSEFSDDNLMVILTEEASFEYIFYNYTAEEFPGIGAISVEELDGATSDTSGLTYKIRQYLLEDPSGNTIPDHLKHYKRFFSITLDKKDKDNVLRAVCILSKRDDIYLVEPDWFISPDV